MMLRSVLMATAALTLSACGANYDVTGARSLPNRGDDFHRALQTDYADLAAAEKSEADWGDTKTFVERARRAASGETFSPEALSNRDIPDHASRTLSEARGRLMSALNDSARTDMPVMAAMAQSAFDCWMQEQEEDRQPADIAACRSSFNTAIRALEASKPAPVAAVEPMSSMPDQFQIYFDFDSANLNAEAQSVVNQISAAHDKYNPATVLVIRTLPEPVTTTSCCPRSGLRPYTTPWLKKASTKVKCGLRPMAKNGLAQISRTARANKTTVALM